MKDWRAGSKDLKTRSEEDERREDKKRAFVSEAEGPFKRQAIQFFFFFFQPFSHSFKNHSSASIQFIWWLRAFRGFVA
jgi:hypothetical protein